MRLRPLALPALLVAFAVSVAKVALTRRGVGPAEYVVCAAAIAAALVVAGRLLRRGRA